MPDFPVNTVIPGLGNKVGVPNFKNSLEFYFPNIVSSGASLTTQPKLECWKAVSPALVTTPENAQGVFPPASTDSAIFAVATYLYNDNLGVSPLPSDWVNFLASGYVGTDYTNQARKLRGTTSWLQLRNSLDPLLLSAGGLYSVPFNLTMRLKDDTLTAADTMKCYILGRYTYISATDPQLALRGREGGTDAAPGSMNRISGFAYPGTSDPDKRIVFTDDGASPLSPVITRPAPLDPPYYAPQAVVIAV